VPGTNTATPGMWKAKEALIARNKETLSALKDDVEADRKEKVEVQAKLDDLEKSLKEDRQEAKKLSVVIEQRFHFSSDLQRMSTVCRVTSSGSGSDRTPSGAYCLSKGSPEAIAALSTSVPEWYEETYRKLAERGQRVLALAYRHLDSNVHSASAYAQKSRNDIEEGLTFAGFISFRCETRKDSALVIKALQDSAHACVMLTGDAPLTALSVANEVGIATGREALILQESEDSKLVWAPAVTTGDTPKEPIDFKLSEIEALCAKHELVITGRSLELALQSSEKETVRNLLHLFRIFARLSPWQKEEVIQAVRGSRKVATLMCGDGGNDVGALKEADVGIALLSGFGNANAGDVAGDLKDVDDAETALAEQRKETAARAQVASKKASEEFARKRRDLMSKQQQWVEEELQARRANGEEVGFKAQFGAMANVMSRMRTELAKEQQAVQKKHGNSIAAGAAKMTSELEAMDDTPMVQLGDASTAAPFTTRTPSIGACIDIVRQGRCTLLSAVQQMEIMMLESMISAYTMSAMSVDGTRPSEAQMMASGLAMTVASLAFTFARPVDRMHKVRPLSSVFHPAILFSMLGQLAIHLSCMVFIAGCAREIMGEDEIKDIIEFEKERSKKIETMEEEAFNDVTWFMSVPFKTNLLNTCCWLVETSQQVAVIFVNYKGQPWMKGLLENQPLFLSLFVCIGLVGICAWGVVPQLNELLNLVVVPEDLRPTVMITLVISVLGSFCWDRLCTAIFAPHVFKAMLDSALAVTFHDLFPLFKTVGYVAGGLVVLGLGNPILWGLAFMMYRNYNKAQAPEAAPPTPSISAQRRPL